MADYPGYDIAPSDIYHRGGGSDVYGLRNSDADPGYKLTDPSIEPTPDQAPTLNDHLLNLYGASLNTLAGVRRGIAQIQSDPDSRKSYDALADEANQSARDAFNQMSPSGQDTATKWNKHWIHGALMGAEQQIPMLAPAGAAEAIGGPAAAAAVYGGLSAGQAADSFYHAVAEAPSWELERNPEYKALVDGGMSEADARQTFAHNHVNDAEQLLVAGVTGAGVGYLGPAAKFFGRGLLGGTGQSALKSIVGGSAEAGTAMGLQTGFMDAAQAHALGGLGLDADSDEDIWKHAGEAALTGAAIGAVGGGVGRIFHREPPPERSAGFRPQDIPRPSIDASGSRAEGPPSDESMADALKLGGYQFRGRSADFPPSSDYTGMDNEAKRTAANERHEDPVAGRNASIEGTGRAGLKPEADTATKTTTKKTTSTPSSPVGDEQNAALDDTLAPQWMFQRHSMIRDLRASDPSLVYSDLLKMNRETLTAAHDKLQAVKEPQAQPEQPAPQQAAAQAPQAPPKPDVTTGLPLGGKPTSAGDFADVPEGGAPSPPPRVEPPREVQPGEPGYDEWAEQVKQAEQGKAAPTPAREAEAPALAPKAPLKAAAEPKLQAVKPTTVMGEALKPLLEKLQTTKAPKEVKPLEERKGKNLTKPEKAAFISNNRRADQIVQEHPATAKDWLAWQPEKSGGTGATTGLVNRLKAMVAAADDPKTGIKTPQLFIRAAKDTLTHSPSVLVIDEAKRLLARFDKEKGRFHTEDIQRYIEREQRLTHPDMDHAKEYNKILEERSKEAERMMAKTGKGPQAGVRQFKEGEEGQVAEGEQLRGEHEEIPEEEEVKHKFSEPLPEPPSIEANPKEWAAWKDEFRDHPLVKASVNLPALRHLRPEDMSNNQLVGLYHDLSKVKAEIDAKMAGKQKGTLAEAVTSAEELKAKHAEEAAEPTVPIGKAAKAIATSKAREEAKAAKKAEKAEQALQAGKAVSFGELMGKLPAVKEGLDLNRIEKAFSEDKPITKVGSKAISFDELLGKTKDGEVPAHMADGTEGTVTSHRTTTVRDALGKVNPSIFPPVFRGMARIMMSKIIDKVGDTPVHLLNDSEMSKLGPAGNIYGKYDTKLDRIYLNTDLDPKGERASIFHEAFHAATIKGIFETKGLGVLVARLWREADPVSAKDVTKGEDILRHSIEWLTYFMTNKDVMEGFKSAKISPELAKDIGIPVWRKKTIFEGVLAGIRKALGFGPRETGAVEAALALSERAIAHREDAVIDAQAKKPPTAFYDEEVPTRLTKEYNGIQGRISKIVDEQVTPRGTGAMLRIKQLFNSPREWMVEMEKNGHFGGAIRQVFEHMSAQGIERENILKLSNPVMKSVATLWNKRPEEYHKLVDLLISSTVNGAHPDYELGEGKNKFIRERENPEESNMDHWEAINGGHAKDRAAYKDLEEPTQEIYRKVRNEFERINEDDIKAARTTLGAAVQSHMARMDYDVGLKDATQKVIDGKKLTKDEQEKYGDDPNIEHLQVYDKMLKDATERGPYFPLKRTSGRYAIIGQYKYEIPKNATRHPDEENRIIFPDRKSAYNFTGEVGLPSYRDTRHFWPQQDGTKKYTTHDNISSEPDWRGETEPAQEFHVVVNPHHVEFADSMVEGEKIRRAMLQAGVDPASLSAVIPAENIPLQKYGLFGPQVKQMVNRLDKLPYLTPDERKGAAEAIEHVAIANMVGNRISQSMLRRNRTAGASEDILKTMDTRRRSSAGFQAMAKHRGAIDDNINQMKDYAKANRNDPNIQAALNMFVDRTTNFQQDALSDMNMSKMWGHISQMATLKYLVSPAFLAYHQLHMPLVVIPRLARDIGWFPAFRVALNTYKQMSGGMPIIGRGFKSAFQRAWDYDKDPIDFIDALKNELQKHGGTDDELKAIQWAEDHDLLHHTGISFSASYRGMGMMDRLEQRSRNISQEIIGSADAINRFNSTLMFYRTARDRFGLRGEEAYRWATDRVAETQGQFSAFNRIEAFRNPNVRAVAQFKSFPLILMKTVTKALYNSLRWGATGEERWQALSTLGGLMGASMALSGVQGAVPEPIEDINNIMSIFGLTNTWDTYEDKLRTMAADNTSPEVANLLMSGLGGALGVDLTHRGGISDLTGLTQLHAAKPQDMNETWLKFVSGVPGAIMGDGLEGIGDLQAGNMTEALKLLVPRAITDPIKAYQLYNQGVTTRAGHVLTEPVGVPDALRRALGFTTQTEAHAREARHMTYLDRQQLSGERANITEMWTQGDRAGAIQAMRDYNESNPDSRMSVTQLQSAAKRAARPTIFGYPDTPQSRGELEHRASVYGLR